MNSIYNQYILKFEFIKKIQMGNYCSEICNEPEI